MNSNLQMSAKDLTRVIVSNPLPRGSGGWHGECGAEGEVEVLNLFAEEGRTKAAAQSNGALTPKTSPNHLKHQA